jgi:hypothetical protein
MSISVFLTLIWTIGLDGDPVNAVGLAVGMFVGSWIGNLVLSLTLWVRCLNA